MCRDHSQESELHMLTWLETTKRARAFSFFPKTDSLPKIADKDCNAMALKPNKMICPSLQTNENNLFVSWQD